MRSVIPFLKTGADGIAVILFTAMFGLFLVQVFSRYVLNAPLGWTVEVCLVLYIWLVFWTSAFILRERDHVSFNMLFLAVSPGKKRVMAIIGMVCIGAGFAASLPIVIDYVAFMRIESTPVLRVGLDLVYAIFPVFIFAVAVRSLLSLWRLASRRWQTEINAMTGEEEPL
ncbi:TRAP transporter small permease [Thalassospira sp.]|uniref:TRAP transporter small permease n=1 Tax=Thalassospira sp. TaxID=1912094 RepID=UPI0027365600|nr:TRAP transporter small permease subunit [Thalassospira sp.]MDP2699414.1 TRAP transporter small permease subunit [Thalassospira sp.]